MVNQRPPLTDHRNSGIPSFFTSPGSLIGRIELNGIEDCVVVIRGEEDVVFLVAFPFHLFCPVSMQIPFQRLITLLFHWKKRIRNGHGQELSMECPLTFSCPVCCVSHPVSFDDDFYFSSSPPVIVLFILFSLNFVFVSILCSARFLFVSSSLHEYSIETFLTKDDVRTSRVHAIVHFPCTCSLSSSTIFNRVKYRVLGSLETHRL